MKGLSPFLPAYRQEFAERTQRDGYIVLDLVSRCSTSFRLHTKLRLDFRFDLVRGRFTQA